MIKKLFLALAFILFLSSAFSESISPLTISKNVRLGEKITVFGTYNNSDANSYVLCRFGVLDSNGFYVERWTDEYTFSDGSFYAEKTAIEPPYYRGDSFTVNVTCGNASDSNSFTVLQPVSLAHPIQLGWDYFFSERNLDAIMILVSSVLLIAGVFLILAFLKKKGGSYAN